MSPDLDADPREGPRHGYRGEVTPVPAARPRGVTVALSREAGARGAAIAGAVGERLGWQVFDQEMLGFLARDEAARAELLADVPADASAWAAARLARLEIADPDLAGVAGLMLAVAARGEVVLVGHGAGFLLPPATTVSVRVVAPWEGRVASLAERGRLTPDEAAAEVRDRDRRRTDLLAALTGRPIADPVGYDLVLNSARLGVDGCADLIAQAVRGKHLHAARQVEAAGGVP